MTMESGVKNKKAICLRAVTSTLYGCWDNSSAGVKAEQHWNQWRYNVWKFSHLFGELTYNSALQTLPANWQEHNNFLLRQWRFYLCTYLYFENSDWINLDLIKLRWALHTSWAGCTCICPAGHSHPFHLHDPKLEVEEGTTLFMTASLGNLSVTLYFRVLHQ